MNNLNAKNNIDDCLRELSGIESLINGIGHMSKPVPYLTKYALIKSCGTIEFCFKTIIADIHINQSSQIQNYIDKTLRESSMNPNQHNICSTLNRFDTNWNSDFKLKLKEHPKSKQIRDSLESLNKARNTFAHGGNVNQSFDNIRDYFNDSVEIIKLLDEIVK